MIVSQPHGCPQMQELIDRIEQEGEYVGDGIVKLDSFLNHQVDADLTDRIGAQFAARFQSVLDTQPTKIVTAEVSGIPGALATARHLALPMLFARKHRSSVMTDEYFSAEATSRTMGEEVRLMISKRYLGPADRVLIIDDFLATGSTIDALSNLVTESGAVLLGIGCVIEKPMEKGRERLAKHGAPIVTLARIEFDDGRMRVG